MDFLTNALFSAENGMLLGAMITHYEPESYLGRASVKFYTKDELYAELPTMEPRGFRLDSSGVLASDTNSRRVLSDSVISFVESECTHLGAREIDITDLVLYGVQHGGAVLINPKEVKGGSTPIFVPFQNYKVSQSSLNIYGSYQMEDGSFRTHSLLELEDGGGKDFHCIFPADVDMSQFASICQHCFDVTVSGTEMSVYAGHSCIKMFYTCVGEAFLNFLAYNIAYYNVGRKFLKAVSPAVKDSAGSEKSPVAQDRRYPRCNVSIEHTFDKLCLDGISKCNGDSERLLQYLQDYPEATVTVHWLNRFSSSPWYTSTEGTEDEKSRAACANLIVECKECALKYGLELLTHRYYLSRMERFDNVVPLVLKGGGVSGESLKRATFK